MSLKNKNCTRTEKGTYNKTFIHYLNQFNSKSIKNENEIELQHETLSLRKIMIKTLSKKPFNKLINLNNNQIKILNRFLDERNFIISSCDKNVGFAIMDKDTYLNLCNEHLNSNNNTYKKLEYNPLTEITNKIKTQLIELNNNGHISDVLLKHLNNNLIQYRVGKFKINPKIHKIKLGIRPIIASINHPTSRMSFVLDFIFKPLVEETEIVLKDSQNLLQDANEISFEENENIHINTGDFESLYTNMDSSKTTEEICNFLTIKKFKNEHISIFGIMMFLKLIFECNVFKFNKDYYIQQKGLAMGCICGPSTANLYLYIKEKNWLNINKPLLYRRFIDDLVHINNKRLDTEDLKNQFDGLNLNIEEGRIVPFLDLNITIDHLKNKIKFFLYIKPTNTFQYLHVKSNHPQHIFKNIPKSLFIRVRRICTDKYDFFFHSRDLFRQLQKRGYEFNFLYKILKNVSKLDRNDLIKYKDKKTIENKFSIRICMGFDQNYLDLKKDIIENFKQIKKDNQWLNEFKINYTNSVLPNFKKLLIDKFNFKFKNSSYTKKCREENCKTCPFVHSGSYIKLKNFMLPFKSFTNCKSEGIVYIIKCTKCDIFYIGESEFSAQKRISQHIYDIKSFVPYGIHKFTLNKIIPNTQKRKRLSRKLEFNICIFKPFKKITEVAEHFNLKDHDLNVHFKFSIFEKNLRDKVIRQSTETDIMNIVAMFGTIINRKIPNHKYIKKLCFA